MTFVDAQQGAVVALAAALFAVATLPEALVYLAALWIFREVYFRPTVTDRTSPTAPHDGMLRAVA